MKSLTLFGSSILRKYPVEITGIIQHILDQLDSGSSFDLLFLQQILQKMCGIEVVHDTTDHQLECLSGGSTLFFEGGCYSVNRNIHKSMHRFKEYLIENNFILPLCLKIAEQRDKLAFGSAEHHSKLLGLLYDQCQNTLVQLMNFFFACLTEEEHARIFQSFTELVIKHHIGIDIAFMFTYRTHQYNIKQIAKSQEESNQVKDKKSPSEIYRYKLVDEIQGLPIGVLCGPRLLFDGSTTSYDISCNSPHFYATFWTCSIFDIQCPIEAYEKQRVHLQDLITKLEKQRETITSNSETYKLTREHEKYTNLIELLHKEEQQHKEHSIKFIESIEGQKHDWFPKGKETVSFRYEYCVYPMNN
ncbi:hypothetical protein GJ496_002641 [Pomphorhynchus laevis]|nr:hypothetical protein GJ496_002641 [Pomphorhynchus laevis]